MKLKGLSLNKLAVLSTITLLITGFAASSLTLEGVTETNGESYTAGEVEVLPDEEQFVAFWQGDQLSELAATEERVFDQRPETGERVDIGVVAPEDEDVEFGDEVKIFDGETGEAVEYTNLNVLQDSKGEYYFFVPSDNPDLNQGDRLEIENKLDNTVSVESSENIGLSQKLDLEDETGTANIYDPVEEANYRIFVDNKQLDLDADRKEGSKTKIKVNVQNPGSAPIDQSDFRTDNGSLKYDIFNLEPGESMLGVEEDIDYEITYSNETFEIELNGEFESSDSLGITLNENNAKIQDVLGNEVIDRAMTVEGLYADSPEVEISFDSQEIPLGDEVSGNVYMRSIDKPSATVESQVLDLKDVGEVQKTTSCNHENWSECYSADFTVEYNDGHSGAVDVTATAENENGETTELKTINAISGTDKVNEIQVLDKNSDGFIETAKVYFSEPINQDSIINSFGDQVQWKLEGIELSAGEEDYDEDEHVLTMTVPDQKQDSENLGTTNADKIDVTHKPIDGKYLEFESGAMVEEIKKGTVDEVDEAAPRLEQANYIIGYDKMVFKFSEPIKQVKNSEYSGNWMPKVAASEGKTSRFAIADIGRSVEQEDADSSVWIQAEDEDGQVQQDENSVSYSENGELIGIMDDGWNIVSLQEGDDVVGSSEEKLSEEYSWINSAYDYDAGWQFADTLGPEKGTFVKASRPGVLKVEKREDSKPADLRTVNGQWNMISPYELTGQDSDSIGFIDTYPDPCDSDSVDVQPEESIEGDGLCSDGSFNGDSTVVNGYWVRYRE